MLLGAPCERPLAVYASEEKTGCSEDSPAHLFSFCPMPGAGLIDLVSFYRRHLLIARVAVIHVFVCLHPFAFSI